MSNLNDIKSEQDEALDDLLQDFDECRRPQAGPGPRRPTPRQVRAYLRGGEIVDLTGDALKFAARMLDDKAPANKRIRRGAIIRVSTGRQGRLADHASCPKWKRPSSRPIRRMARFAPWSAASISTATSSTTSPRPGGNRDPASSPSSTRPRWKRAIRRRRCIPDEPISISAEETGSQAWEPKNYDGKYEGPMTLRTALAKSKNMVSIRLLQSIGTHYAQDYVTRFGFDADKHPPYLTLALGAGSVTPWQQLTAYSVFANGGYKIEPYVVKQILDDKGNVLAQAQPVMAGDENLRVIDARNAYLMDSMMHDVVRRGTAARAGASSSAATWPARPARPSSIEFFC